MIKEINFYVLLIPILKKTREHDRNFKIKIYFFRFNLCARRHDKSNKKNTMKLQYEIII